MCSLLITHGQKYYNITTTLHFEDNRQQTTDNGGRQPVFRLLSFAFRRSSAKPKILLHYYITKGARGVG